MLFTKEESVAYLLFHQSAIVNGFTKISKCVNHTLHLLTVIHDQQVALDEGPKLSIKDEGTCLFVTNELTFKGKPRRS